MIGYIAVYVLVIFQLRDDKAGAHSGSRVRRQIVTPVSGVPNVSQTQPTTSSLGSVMSDPLQDAQMFPLPQFLECLSNPGSNDDCCLGNQVLVCHETILQQIEDCTNIFYIEVQEKRFDCDCKETTLECEYKVKRGRRKRMPGRRSKCNRLSRIFTHLLKGGTGEYNCPNVEPPTSSSTSTSTTSSTTPSTTESTTESTMKSTAISTTTHNITSSTAVIINTAATSGGLHGRASPQNEADAVTRAALIGGVIGGIFIGILITLTVLAILLFLCGFRKRIDFRKLKEEKETEHKEPEEETETALCKPVAEATGSYHIYELPDMNANNSNPATGSKMAALSGNTKYDNLGEMKQRPFKPSARYDALDIVRADSQHMVINNDYDHTIMGNDDVAIAEVDSSRENYAQATCVDRLNDNENGSSSSTQNTIPNPYTLATAVPFPISAKETSL